MPSGQMIASPDRPRPALALLAAGTGLAVLTLAAGLGLTSDGVPAGFRQMLGEGTSPLRLVALGVGILWLSVAPAFVGGQLLRRPVLAVALPVWATAIGFVAWLLFRAAAPETAGGPGPASSGSAAGPAMAWASVALLLVMASAAISALCMLHREAALRGTLSLLLIGAPWLALATIIFLNTDALGPLGRMLRAEPLPGGPLLVPIILAMGVNGAAVGHALRRPALWRWLATLVATGLLVTLGWLLLQLTLEPLVAAAGVPSLGVRWLLSADAAHSEGESLFLRWCLLYVAAVLVLGWGNWAALLASTYGVAAPLAASAVPHGGDGPWRATAAPTHAGRAYLILTTLYAAFIVYGSLVPLDFRAMTLEDAWTGFLRLWPPVPEYFSRSDVVANTLLGVPLGFLAMGLLTRENTRRGRWLAVIAALLLAGAVGFVAEFGQMFCPERTPSFSDVLAQTAGAGIGIVVWLAAGGLVTAWARGIWAEYVQHEQALKILAGYVVVLVLYQLLPFNLTISLTEVYHKFKAGQVTLVPFADTAGLTPYVMFSKMALIVPVGYALVLLRRDRSVGLAAVVLMGAVFAAGIEFLQLFVLPRYTSATDVVLGAVGAGLGAIVARHFGPAATRSLAETPFWARFGWFFKCVAVAAMGAGLVWFKWNSLALVWPAEGLMPHAANVVCVPLTSFYYQTELGAASQVAREFMAFLVFGLFVRSLAGDVTPRGRAASVLAMVAVILAAVALEAGQLLIPRHEVDPASVVIQAAGGVAGVLAYARFVRTFVSGPLREVEANGPWSTT